MSTIQLDFVARKRFGLTYTDESGKENGDVFVVHRAPLSTHERCLAFLIEHYAGAFPLWLAPVQVRVAAVGEAHRQPVYSLVGALGNLGIRGNRRVGRHRWRQDPRRIKMKIPYTIVFGDKEKDGDDFQIRVYRSAPYRAKQTRAHAGRDKESTWLLNSLTPLGAAPPVPPAQCCASGT